MTSSSPYVIAIIKKNCSGATPVIIIRNWLLDESLVFNYKISYELLELGAAGHTLLDCSLCSDQLETEQKK